MSSSPCFSWFGNLDDSGLARVDEKNVLFCTRDAQNQSYDDGHVEPRKRSTKSLPVVLGSSSKWRRSVFKSRWACVLKQAASRRVYSLIFLDGSSLSILSGRNSLNLRVTSCLRILMRRWGLLFTSKLPGGFLFGTANSKAIRAERPEDMCLAIARAKAGL